jgi:hypothetical protein
MSKVGKQLVCVLNKDEVFEWTEKINNFIIELAKQHIAQHHDITKVSDINPIEGVIISNTDGVESKIINKVEIDFFVEE